MLFATPNAVGIDYSITGLQNGLYRRLKSVWGVTDNTYNCFGRAYRNMVDGGYIAEFYNAEAQNYVSGLNQSNQGGMFFEDTIAAMSYLLCDQPIRNSNGTYSVKAQLLFFVNLDKITPYGLTQQQQQGQRMDETAVNDVVDYIQANGNNWTILATYTDIDKVLEKFSGKQKKESLNDDMHPRFCFRIDMNLNYNKKLNRQNQVANSFIT